MTRTLDDALTRVATMLAAAGIPDPRREARLIVRHATGWDDAAMLTDPGRELGDDQAAALDAMAARRASREPMAYIMGEREFWSLPFRVTPATLVPRPDTETVVEAVLADIGDKARTLRILDLGTGSGCLLLALLSEFPNASGLGIDISEAAIEVAKINATRLGFDVRATFRIGDWLDGVEERFEIVVANPPYVADRDIPGLDADVRSFEPLGALAGGPDGFDAYRRIAGRLGKVLAVDGIACFEVGVGQADSVAAIFAGQGFRVHAVRADLAGTPRVVAVSGRV